MLKQATNSTFRINEQRAVVNELNYILFFPGIVPCSKSAAKMTQPFNIPSDYCLRLD